jgi:hypothetical protein
MDRLYFDIIMDSIRDLEHAITRGARNDDFLHNGGFHMEISLPEKGFYQMREGLANYFESLKGGFIINSEDSRPTHQVIRESSDIINTWFSPNIKLSIKLIK